MKIGLLNMYQLCLIFRFWTFWVELNEKPEKEKSTGALLVSVGSIYREFFSLFIFHFLALQISTSALFLEII